MDNPFVTKGYAGAEYFCDRVEETMKLVELTTNGNNMALISPRRVGKTVPVLVEGVSRDNKEELLGQIEQHEKIAFKADRKLIGSFVNVKITELSGNTYRGEYVPEPSRGV